jgi:uncharacterized membrane protein
MNRMTDAKPTDGQVRLTHIIYALHAFSAVAGMLGPALIVTSFLTGWPSIIAVVINYAKRGDVRGTWLESHFQWQIRTFWYALLWLVIGALLAITLIGIPAAVVVVLATGLWVLYRISRGWLRLNDRQAM